MGAFTIDTWSHFSIIQLANLLDGKFSSTVHSFAVVDCRFQYEYDGGHIRDAINLNTQEELLARFLPRGSENASPSATPQVLVFHCEFSSHRGPRMYDEVEVCAII